MKLKDVKEQIDTYFNEISDEDFLIVANKYGLIENDNMIKKYRKKPVVIEAIQFTGTNIRDCAEFLGKSYKEGHSESNEIVIHTLEGDMTASEGDYIIKGVNGEFYPCKPDIFQKTYEEVVE